MLQNNKISGDDFWIPFLDFFVLFVLLSPLSMMMMMMLAHQNSVVDDYNGHVLHHSHVMVHLVLLVRPYSMVVHLVYH